MEQNNMAIEQHPRPDFCRDQWFSLSGTWQFSFDDEQQGLALGWHMPGVQFERSILVPFAYQTELSTVGDEAPHSMMWYKKTVAVPGSFQGKRVILHFGAVDYHAVVFVNGEWVCEHIGGYTPFHADITRFCDAGIVDIAVRVTDRPDPAQPRGKQFWKHPERCWYTPSSGIWQSVWLECIQGTAITCVAATPDIDHAQVSFQIGIESYTPNQQIEMEISFKGQIACVLRQTVPDKRFRVCACVAEPDYIDELHYWSPHAPNLYDVTVRLYEGESCQDTVHTYFGFRKVALEQGRIMLNNSPVYLKMILDQGYWRTGGLTAPAPDAFEHDILLMKAMGFNGVRKHQKIEDPLFYYWADKLGILVWGELPSAYQFCAEEMDALSRDMTEFIRRDFNHPSIIAWVPLNESWGVRKMRDDGQQQSFARALYHLTKAHDPTRLVDCNDGWEIVESDIISVHDYAPDPSRFSEKYANVASDVYPMSKRLFALGQSCRPDAAVMVTEYGGIALSFHAKGEKWGYNGNARDGEELVKRYRALTKAIMDIPSVCGFCYTQLSDVYQEVNGLLDFDHQPKLDPEKIAEANRS